MSHWPNGESWCLGDSPTVGVLLGASERSGAFEMVPVPRIRYEYMTYDHSKPGRPIRVYKRANERLILGDLFAKLKINYG